MITIYISIKSNKRSICRIIVNNIKLGKIKDAEDSLYYLIKMKKKYQVQNMFVYDSYNSLFQVFLKYQPNKVRVSFN